MYKIVAVAGKIRGKEFILKEGENIFGRDAACDHQVAVDGVSKKHFSMTVTGDTAYLKDLGSSNGTFLNGKITKQATVKGGDKLALPDIIFQVVFVQEKKVIIKKTISKIEEGAEAEDLNIIPPPPPRIHEKFIWLFKYKLMPILHGINEEYEWRIMLGILLAIFVFATIALTIFPVLQESSHILLIETAKRGEHFAEEIARLNARWLEQKNLDRVDSAFLETEADVASYELFDLEGRIVRPMGKLNEYTSDPLSIKAKEWAGATANKNTNALKEVLGDGEIGIAQKIMAYNTKTGQTEAVGVIAIHFTPKSLAVEATKNSAAFLEALTTSGIIAIFFFGIVYYLTVKPLEEIRIHVEETLRGKRRGIETKLLFSELQPLKSALNTILQRIRDLTSTGGEQEFKESEDAAPYVNSLKEFIRGAAGPTMVLDADKNLKAINSEGEDLTGIRQTASEGMSLLDVAREQGFAATVIELCDKCANNGGVGQDGTYSLTGHEYKLYANALMGKDHFAKAYYITFIKG